MRKLFTTFLLTLVCLSNLWAQREIEVSTAKELQRAILSNYKARIKLVADIDISELGKICDTFAGSIDGGYMIIDSLGKERIAPHVLKGKRGQERGADHYLFETLDHAMFENVAFERFRVEDEDNDNLGVVARKAIGSVFWNFTMAGVSVFCDHDNAGAIVGVAEDCTFDNVKILDCDVTVDGISAGGMVGSSKRCKYTACTTNVHTRVFADGRDGVFFSTNAANSGGLVGFSESDEFLLCLNSGWVGGDQERVGGFVGCSMGSHFTKCSNFGYVIQCTESSFGELYSTNAKNIGDYDYLFGDMKWVLWSMSSVTAVGMAAAVLVTGGIAAPVIFTAAVMGTMCGLIVFAVDAFLLSNHDELGGIVGHAEHGSFEECANHGYYKCVDKMVGGIVGWGKYIGINNCLSTRSPRDGNGSGTDYSGSIIGVGLESTITNCLSNTNYPLYGSDSELKVASGNNYVVSDKKMELSDYETRVPTELAKTGIVARWLNNGYENWSKQVHPWYQTLTDKSKDEPADAAPVNSSKHDVVRIKDIKNVTVITTGDELEAFAKRVNDGDQYACAVLDDDVNLGNRDWTPIGTESHPFRGMFDGCGHTIYALAIKMEKNMSAGLFGVVADKAEVRNVAIANDSKISSNSELGTAGIVGRVNIESASTNVVIASCGNYANVSGTKHVGGILGRVMTDGSDNIKVMMDSCFNMGTITASQSMSAQLCGYAKDNGYIMNSWVGGRLERLNDSCPLPYNNDNPTKEAEYFAGYNNRLTINNCYAINPNELGSFTQQSGVTRTSWDEFNRLGWNYIKPTFSDVTGIDSLLAPGLSGDCWYDLNGRRVDENYRGVRVGGGKKVIVK